ncbi:recombinase family protein [Ruminococcus sp. AM46-18]|nr:recombinase family protein [Ruminococcus sp. AM46-18]
MNYAQKIRQILTTNSSETIRAVIYARVSTDNEGQKESCANQVDLAHYYIAKHPNITLVETYIDDGISGKNDFSRPQYGEMLQLLTENGFDLIITKALSRLNRSEYNSLALTNLLLAHEATILTLEDNQIHDFEDLNSGLLHSISFAMDAQYVQKQSISGRKTQELRCKNKILTAKDCSYGYDWQRDHKIITINEKQAAIVRLIFEEYVYHNGTPASIKRMLEAQGITICNRSISNIIQDERYIGKFYINKRTSKLGTGQTKSKRIKLPKKDWVLIERPDLQIIDPDIFEMAQRIHQTRITVYEKPDNATTQARFQGTHLYAGKIFCPTCGKPYHFGYADRKKTCPIYRIKSHSKCSNPVNRITEADMEEITRQALQKIISQQDAVCTSLEAILISCVEASQDNSKEISALHAQITTREKQIDSLIDALSEGGLTESSKERIKTKINVITNEIDNLNKYVREKESHQLSDSYVSEKIAELKAAIATLKNFTSIDRDRIQNYIERIELPANGDIIIFIKSGQMITFDKSTNDFSVEAVGKTRIQDALYSMPEAYPLPLRRGLLPL